MNEPTIPASTPPATAGGSGKNYEVIVKAYSVVVVMGAKNASEAEELAMDAVSTGDFDVEEAFAEREITDPKDLDRARKRANCVAEDDDEPPKPSQTGGGQ